MRPAPCEPTVFADGAPVLIVSTGATGGASIFEGWVQALARACGCAVDWHYSGGRAQVLTLGDPEDVRRVARGWDLPLDPEGYPMTVLSWCEDGAGLYRAVKR